MHKEDMDSPGGGFLAKQVAAGKLPSSKPKRKKKTTKKRKRNTGLRY